MATTHGQCDGMVLRIVCPSDRQGRMGWNVFTLNRYSLTMTLLSLSLWTGTRIATADTVMAVPVRDGFDVVLAVTAGLIGATFLAVLLTFLFLLLQARRVATSLEKTRDRLASDRGIEHLRSTAANVEEISKTLRDEVGKLSSSVSLLSDRLSQASTRMEERIEEFNALMEVIQSEAEEVFVDTASTARGVRRGLGSLADPHASARRGSGTGHRSRPGPAPADREDGAPEDASPTEERPLRTPPSGDPLRHRGPQAAGRSSTPDGPATSTQESRASNADEDIS